MKKYQRRSIQAYVVCGNTAVKPADEEDRSVFPVVLASGCPDGTAETVTELTRAGEVLSALMGVIETVLIFLIFRLSLSYVPVLAVGVLWISLTILSDVFLEWLLPALNTLRVLIRCMRGRLCKFIGVGPAVSVAQRRFL